MHFASFQKNTNVLYPNFKNKSHSHFCRNTHGTAATLSLVICFCPRSLRGSAHTWHIVYVRSMLCYFTPRASWWSSSQSCDLNPSAIWIKTSKSLTMPKREFVREFTWAISLLMFNGMPGPLRLWPTPAKRRWWLWQITRPSRASVACPFRTGWPLKSSNDDAGNTVHCQSFWLETLVRRRGFSSAEDCTAPHIPPVDQQQSAVLLLVPAVSVQQKGPLCCCCCCCCSRASLCLCSAPLGT